MALRNACEEKRSCNNYRFRHNEEKTTRTDTKQISDIETQSAQGNCRESKHYDSGQNTASLRSAAQFPDSR